jgi:predicted metal-dependent hydrolase
MSEPPLPFDRLHQAEGIRQGQIAFNRGEFFVAHERWEEVWLELKGTERLAVQGLIQIAAGLHHLKAGRGDPAARLLEKGVTKLSSDESTTELLAGLRVTALIRDVAQLLADLRASAGSSPELSRLAI